MTRFVADLPVPSPAGNACDLDSESLESLESLAKSLCSHLSAAEEAAQKCLDSLRMSGVVEVTEEHLVQEHSISPVRLLLLSSHND